MKMTSIFSLLAGLGAGLAILSQDSSAQAPPVAPPAVPETNAPALPEQPPTPVPLPIAPPEEPTATNTALVEAVSTNGIPNTFTNLNPEDGLRLNFRGVPLEMVLNYLSEAAGFVVVLETDVRGKVDVWSNSPVTQDEAVNLLDAVLRRNGYAAIRNGRTLTIVARDAAKTHDIPVKRGSDPEEIPKTDEIVTQIIPVRYINATQLTKDLTPLLPTAATMTANEGGNSLVITDTQTSIRRMAEIVKALDTSVAAISAVRVFPLKYADAKTVATVIRDVFQNQNSSQRDMRAQFMARFRRGPFGGGGAGEDSGGSTSSSAGRASMPQVVATSDDRSNSLVVSAPEELMPTIEELVTAVDTNVEDVTEVRVFRLRYADPVEMADLLANLFPDDTRSDSNNRFNMRFGGGFPGGPGMFGRQRGGGNSDESERSKKMGRVLAVADQRTSSVVVSAARDLMTQITAMIEQLDANPAKKQKVYVYSLENADVQEVEQILRDMFDRSGTMNNRNNANQNSALNTRSLQQQQGGTTMGLGTSGTGGSRGLGGSGSLGGAGF